MMRVQTFVGRVSAEALSQMDQHINHWLEAHRVEPRLVTQTFGYDKPKETGSAEPLIVTSIWY